MKKLSILLIGLLLVAGVAVADFGDVAVSGSASVTWGIDLNSNATGFANAGTSEVVLTLIDTGSGTTGGDDGLFGEITLTDWGMDITDSTVTGTGGAVTAKIVVSPIEILIYGAPAMSWGNASPLQSSDTDDVAPALASLLGNTIGGITIVLPFDPAEISIYAVSDGDWTAANENTDNDYAVGTDVEVAIDIITIAIGGYYGWFNAAASYGLTAALDVALDVLYGLDIAVGFDLIDAPASNYEVSFGTTVSLTEANADDAMSDISVDVVYSENWDLDVVLGVSEPTAGGFVDMLGAGITVELFDLTSGTIIWNVDVTGDYDAGGLMPYFGFGYGSDTIFDLNVGVELSADFTGIDNTTVTLDYESTQLSPAPADNGIITAEVEVTY